MFSICQARTWQTGVGRVCGSSPHNHNTTLKSPSSLEKYPSVTQKEFKIQKNSYGHGHFQVYHYQDWYPLKEYEKAYSVVKISYKRDYSIKSVVL